MIGKKENGIGEVGPDEREQSGQEDEIGAARMGET
jgi:hypothetical protein